MTTIYVKKCEQCKKNFENNTPRKRFCSKCAIKRILESKKKYSRRYYAKIKANRTKLKEQKKHKVLKCSPPPIVIKIKPNKKPTFDYCNCGSKYWTANGQFMACAECRHNHYCVSMGI